jgi:hypothetical protein
VAYVGDAPTRLGGTTETGTAGSGGVGGDESALGQGFPGVSCGVYDFGATSCVEQ